MPGLKSLLGFLRFQGIAFLRILFFSSRSIFGTFNFPEQVNISEQIFLQRKLFFFTGSGNDEKMLLLEADPLAVECLNTAR